MSVENSIVRALKGRAQAMAERRLAPFVRPAIDLESARTGLTKPGQTSKLLTDPRHHATSTMPFYSEPSGGVAQQRRMIEYLLKRTHGQGGPTPPTDAPKDHLRFDYVTRSGQLETVIFELTPRIIGRARVLETQIRFGHPIPGHRGDQRII